MNPAWQRHIKYNRATADRWRDFESHREQVMELLCGGASTDASLCVLGAGNCNDLDLKKLGGCFEKIHLFDIDGEAMAAALLRQGANPSRIELHGGQDLGGFYAALDAGADAEQTRAAIDALAAPRAGPFDVVASVCLLSQLKHSLFVRFGEDEKIFGMLCDAVRRRHYDMLEELMRPDARGVLVTDFTSSDLYPPLSTCSDENFIETTAAALAAGRCFHRNAPALLEADLQTRPGVKELETLPHWRWMIWPTHFAVCGFTWLRADS